MYIHDLKEWPNFLWNVESLTEPLAHLRYSQGRLIGGMAHIGFDFRKETLLQSLTQDIVKSSLIEGERLDSAQVRSSVARHLGMDKASIAVIDRNIEGVVEMMLDATQKYDEPLTKERLLAWHSTLFPSGRSGFKKIKAGKWRTGSVQVVSGPMGEETVHFEGPDAKRIDHEIELFLKWIENKEIDLILKAAIAHLWFVTLHPFEDGNGRIGRAIADLLLARSENSRHRFYSLSSQIQRERKHYYAILEKTQKGNLDITPWIEWFVACLTRAIDKALATLEATVVKTEFFNALKNIAVNARQRKILIRLLDGFKGKLTSSKWAKMGKCSQDTALRDIAELIDKDILLKHSAGPQTHYSLNTKRISA
jgi:Fic family protein